MHKNTDLCKQEFPQPPDWHQQKLARASLAWSWRICETDASVPTTYHRVIQRKKDSGTIRGIEFKKIPCSWAASDEYILFNCLAVCLVYLNKIWCAVCTVRNTFGYHSLRIWYDQYLCSWNINEFSCFTFYCLTVTRTWTRRH